MVKRIIVYGESGEMAGRAHVDTNEIGEIVAEVYDEEGNKLGAVKYEPSDMKPYLAYVYDPDGAQLGFLQLERYEIGIFGSDILWREQPGEEYDKKGHVRMESADNNTAIVREKAETGEQIGSLEGQNVSGEELTLIGGAAALLVLL